MQSGSIKIYSRNTCVGGFAILLAMSLTAAGCSDSTGPGLNLTGSWLGGSPVTLLVAFEQTGPLVRAAGELSKIGTKDSFGLAIQGIGTISSDSTIRVELDGQYLGHHVLEGRLLETGIISGTISGDHIGGDGIQVITLARYYGAP